MKRGHVPGGIAISALALILGLVWIGTAAAYQRQYYLGTPSAPIRITFGTTAAQTSNAAFRLFNEATATSQGADIDVAKLYYNNTLIGSKSNTYYFVVYQNGPNSRAGCQLTKNAYEWAWVYCDASI